MSATEEGEWDSHVHVFDPNQHPFHRTRNYTPAQALGEDLLRSTSAHNFLIVQASIEDGPENVLHQASSLTEKYPNRLFRAEIVYEDSACWSLERLRQLHCAGVRCLRVRLPQQQAAFETTATYVEQLLRGRLGDMARTMGWSIAMQLSLPVWHLLVPFLERSVADHNVKIIAEHCCSINVPITDEDLPAVDAVLHLLRRKAIFVKLGALHRRIASDGSSDMVMSIIRAMAEAGPKQLLWGSDWPHVDATPSSLGKEAPHLHVDHAEELSGVRGTISPSAFRSMLVHTPARLFGR